MGGGDVSQASRYYIPLQGFLCYHAAITDWCIIVLEIYWERAKYTTREEEGSVEVCVEASQVPTTYIPLNQVVTREGTAREGTGK